MPRLIAFDLDGTLVDSRRDIASAANAVLVEAGAAPLPLEAITRMVGDGAAMLVGRAFAAAGVAPPPDALDRWLAIYDSLLLDQTRPYPGMLDLLATVQRCASLAVLTNKPLEPARRILDGLGLSAFFDRDAVVGGDGPLARKPDPAGLRFLMARAGATPADTLLVGDSVIDVRTAVGAGVDICLARYGFGFGQVPPDALPAAAKLIDTPLELLELLS